MDKTRLLNVLEKDSPHFIKASKDYLNIMEVIESFKLGINAALSFIDKLSLCMDDYILAIRSRFPPDTIKIFLKRGIAEIRVNNYNEILMKCWEANMDIQYIVDPYSCAAYVVSYMSKGQRGMSVLLQQACKAAQNNGSDIQQQVRKVGNVFLSHVELGAQEAAYILLQMPLRKASIRFS